MIDYSYTVEIDNMEVEDVELSFTDWKNGKTKTIRYLPDYFDRETGAFHCKRYITIGIFGKAKENSYNYRCYGQTSSGEPWEFNSKDLPNLPMMKIKPRNGYSFKGEVHFVIGEFPQELKSIEERLINFKGEKIEFTKEEKLLLNNYLFKKIANHKYKVTCKAGDSNDYEPILSKGCFGWEDGYNGINNYCNTTNFEGLEGILVKYSLDFNVANKGLVKKINKQIEYAIFHDEWDEIEEDYDEGFDESVKTLRHQRRLRY